MKHWIACLSAVVLVVTGCDTVNHSQLQVLAPKPQRGATATVPIADREFVKQVLSDIATRHRFEDRTQISLNPDTICSYAEPDVKYPLRMVAWVSQDRISIDLFQKPPETGETEAYRKLRSEITTQLKDYFGNRLTMVGTMNQATGRSTAKP
jgi:hypothetical protein